MGTRGAYGFRKNGEDKITYNHYDSDPDWLGEKMATFCVSTSIEQMNSIFDNITLVDGSSMPNLKQVKACRDYTDLSVSYRSQADWYCLLRNAQGDLSHYKAGLSYMTDYSNFIKDSLFCEYAYIINLDENVLEFWVGYQQTPDRTNRYGAEKVDNYYPCKLLKTFALDSINPDEVVEQMNCVSEMDYMEQKCLA